MKNATNHVTEMLISSNLSFLEKPILIGGMAMEYYEIRKAGADIDLIITDDDYQVLARKYPNQRKDLYGDLELLKKYYYKNYTNQKYHQEAQSHEKSYLKMNGAVLGGKYDDL